MMKSSEIPTTCLESRTQIREWPLARRREGSEALGCQGGGKVSGFSRLTHTKAGRAQ
jgi:hypothetical protein